MQELMFNSNHLLIICSKFLPPLLTSVSPISGTGTFGRVFLVKDKKTRTFYALKQMKIPDVIRLKQEQHVHNEKEVLTEVTHPFIIRLWVSTHFYPQWMESRGKKVQGADFVQILVTLLIMTHGFCLTMHILYLLH